MKTFVKFCGITDAAALAEVPAGGAAGFVTGVPESPRNLDLPTLARLAEAVPNEVEPWAVVVRPPAELIHRLFDEAGIERVQVYGPVPDGLEYLEIHHLVPSIAVPAPGGSEPEPVVPAAADYPRVHLDAAGLPVPGGSGVRPDWTVCARLVEQHPGRKFVLAGGLTPENVAEALGIVHPWGVDVSTGIESRPGTKDPERMRAFVRSVETYESGHA